MKLNQEDSDKYNKLKSDIDFLSKRKSDLGRKIDSATELSGLTVSLQRLLEEELAPIKFKRCIEMLDSSDVYVSNLQDIIGKIDRWSFEMRNLLTNKYDDVIDVLGFAVNSYKLQILQTKAKTRVYELLDNNPTSIEFMVWSHYFFIKINLDIAHHFNVSKCYNINVENFDEACILAERWNPTDGYILAKIEEMKNKVQNGTLKQERVMALNMYLKHTEDGKSNPFAA